MAILISLLSVSILLASAVQFAWHRIAFLKTTFTLFFALVSSTWATDYFYKPYPNYSHWNRWNCTLSGHTDCLGLVSPMQETRVRMENLSESLKTYHSHCNHFPTTEQGLDALLNRPTRAPDCKNWGPQPYIAVAELKDGWGYPLQYISDGNTFKVNSLGRDGQVGGEGSDRDITFQF